jgi:hypothetical protein
LSIAAKDDSTLGVKSLNPEFVRHLQKDAKRLITNLRGGGWTFTENHIRLQSFGGSF